MKLLRQHPWVVFSSRMGRNGIEHLNFTYDFLNLFCLFSREKKGWARSIAVSIFQWTILSSVALRLAGEVMAFYKYIHKMEAWLEITCLFLNSLSTLSRMMFLVSTRDGIFNILHSWEEMFVRNQLLRPNIPRMREKIRRMDIFMKTLMVLTVLSYFHWMLNPNFASESEDDHGRRLPLIAWYPYKMYTSPYYEVTFFCQSLVALVSVYSMFAVQGFYIIVCVLAKFQVTELQTKLRLIGATGRGRLTTEEPTGRQKRKIKKKLVECVHHHIFVRRFIKDIDKVFGYVILLDFLQLAAVMCLTTVEATSTHLIESRSLAWLEYFLVSLQQLFLCCWTANEVTTQMKRLIGAVSEGLCGYITKDTRWNLNFMMLHCSGDVILTGGGFINLSVDSFTKMIGLVLSNYVVLRQLKETRNQ